MSKLISEAKIVCDSISPAGHRLVSFEAKFPRPILAEVNTHRTLSRVSASSRAIPVEKMIRRVLENPYVPTHWGQNQKGMQAEQDVDEQTAGKARQHWLLASGMMRAATEALLALGIHKQITNRLIEPFMWHLALISATEWSNFFHLRDHKAAHPDFRDLAHAMRELYQKSEPKQLGYDDWHMPYITDEDAKAAVLLDTEVTPSFPMSPTDPAVRDFLRKVSVGRCARTSTLTHDGKRDLEEDVALHDRMMKNGHASPYEHVARPMTAYELELFKQKKLRWAPHPTAGSILECWNWVGSEYEKEWTIDGSHYRHGRLVKEGEYTHFLGNVQGWVQMRKLIPHEEDIFGAVQL